MLQEYLPTVALNMGEYQAQEYPNVDKLEGKNKIIVVRKRNAPTPPPRPGVDDVAPLATMDSDDDLASLDGEQGPSGEQNGAQLPAQHFRIPEIQVISYGSQPLRGIVSKVSSLPCFPTFQSGHRSLPHIHDCRSESEPNISPIKSQGQELQAPSTLHHATRPLIPVNEFDKVVTEEGAAASCKSWIYLSGFPDSDVEYSVHKANRFQDMKLLMPPRHEEKSELSYFQAKVYYSVEAAKAPGWDGFLSPESSEVVELQDILHRSGDNAD